MSRLGFGVLALLVVAAATVHAQEPADSLVADSAARVRQDSVAADSAARAERDSLAAEVARELGVDSVTAAAGPAAADSAVYGPPQPAARGAPQSFNPDLSVIGDFLVDLSPDEPALEEGDRFLMREVELGFQATVDPYFRGDFFIALKEGEIELEEGYLTTLALPSGLQARAGRFHLPFGKVNLTHRPELHTIEYPRVVQVFFGDDGFATTGLWASKILAPLGFYQELIGVAGNDLGEGIGAEEPAGEEDAGDPGEDDDRDDGDDDGDLLDDLGDRLFLGHLKNYVDLSEAANLEIGGSVATGEDRPGEADASRLTFWGIDAILRWRPPAAALYRSLILQGEAVWRDGPVATDFGAFLFGQWQVGRRWYVGARYDFVEHPEPEADESENALSGYLTYYPSEFSLFRLGYEHRALELEDDEDRVLVQATVTLGPHRPHPF